jgi:hypothetical protein
MEMLWGLVNGHKPIMIIGPSDLLLVGLPPICSPSFSFMGGIAKNVNN